MNLWGLFLAPFIHFSYPNMPRISSLSNMMCYSGFCMPIHPRPTYLTASQCIPTLTNMNAMRDYGGNIARGLSYNDSYNNKKRSY